MASKSQLGTSPGASPAQASRRDRLEPDNISDELSPFTEVQRTRSQSSRAARNERRASRPSVEYELPDFYHNLDEISGLPPVQNVGEDGLRRASTGEDDYVNRRSLKRLRTGSHGAAEAGGPLALARTRSRRMSAASAAAREDRMLRRQSTAHRVDYDMPDAFANLNEASGITPVQNPDEDVMYEHTSLEEARSHSDRAMQRRSSQASRTQSLPGNGLSTAAPGKSKASDPLQTSTVSKFATQLYTISYLILFSLFGTLARLGLQALTTYPGSPIIFASIWPNFAGSLIMGFLAEERMLFRFDWGTPPLEMEMQRGNESAIDDEESGSSDRNAADMAAAKKAYLATKKTIPLYIGLATGFCGSFTSFSAFARDAFLAMSNDLVPTGSRNDGYSVMALLAVLLTTISLSLAAVMLGAHLAIALEPITPSLPYLFTRKILDRVAVVSGWGCWLGAVLLSALPPDRGDSGAETWRGRAIFALVFAPLGCLARFYASLYLNGRISFFPLGTFTVNIAGTAILGTAWDLAHVPLGGFIGCQVLQGVEDGFCGCLTTVSTWVAELKSLRRRNAYIYGSASVVTALALLIAIMGGLRWSDGFANLECTH
jgi:fluoride exporter